MLEKEVMTEYGVPCKFWVVIGYAYHIKDGKGFIQLEGFSTEDSELKALGVTNIPFTIEEVLGLDPYYLPFHFEDTDVLESLVERLKAWKEA